LRDRVVIDPDVVVQRATHKDRSLSQSVRTTLCRAIEHIKCRHVLLPGGSEHLLPNFGLYACEEGLKGVGSKENRSSKFK